MPPNSSSLFFHGPVIDPDAIDIGQLTVRELILRPFKQTDEDRERIRETSEKARQGKEQARRRIENQERTAAVRYMRLKYGTSMAGSTGLPQTQSQPAMNLDLDNNAAELLQFMDSQQPGFHTDSVDTGGDFPVDELELGLDFDVQQDQPDEMDFLGLERVDEGDMTAGLNRVPVGVTYKATSMMRRGSARLPRRHDTLRNIGGAADITDNTLQTRPFTWMTDDARNLAELITVLGPNPSLLSTVFNYRRLGPNWLGTQGESARPDETGPRPATARDIALFIKNQSRQDQDNPIKRALVDNQSGHISEELLESVYDEMRRAHIDAEPVAVHNKRQLAVAEATQPEPPAPEETSSAGDLGLPDELLAFGGEEVIRDADDASLELESSGASMF